jgi:hypothetical protein
MLVKSRKGRWAGHVARVEEKWNAHRTSVGKRLLKGLDVGGRITLKCILEGWCSIDWTDLAHGTEQCVVLVDTAMDLRGPLQDGKLPEWLSDFRSQQGLHVIALVKFQGQGMWSFRAQP